MDDLTAYFLTTDRVTAPEARASLDAQGLRHPVVEVRNVRPLAAAMRRALDCPTDYAAIIDDDIVLRPFFLPAALSEFKAKRARSPRFYVQAGGRYCDGGRPVGGGGTKIYYLPLLRKIGFPDAPHMMYAQRMRAQALGYARSASRLVVGHHAMGTLLDVYQRYLWETLRWRLGQLHWGVRVPVLDVARRARERDVPEWWAAYLGAVDGVLVEWSGGSKDESLRGPLAQSVDFDAPDVAQMQRLIGASRLRWLPRYAAAVALRGAEHGAARARRITRNLRELLFTPVKRWRR